MHIAQIVLLIARFILIAITLLVLTGAAQLLYKESLLKTGTVRPFMTLITALISGKNVVIDNTIMDPF